jgi:CBS domain-containing protein
MDPLSLRLKIGEIAEQLRSGDPPIATPRAFLTSLGVARRGVLINREIRQALREYKLKTVPDFEIADVDATIRFARIDNEQTTEPEADRSATDTNTVVDIAGRGAGGATGTGVLDVNTLLIGGASADPTYRVGRLDCANRKPLSVRPDASLSEAFTLMMANDYSQLPVMTSDREVKGIISWTSIAIRMALGLMCEYVRDCMESHVEIINSDVSLFSVIHRIVEVESVLVRNDEKVICGMITTSDLSVTFDQLAEPFLVLGEIENHIRRLIDGKFTKGELNEFRDPGDLSRQVDDVSELTFGEYLRLLENPDRWNKLGLKIDRNTFVKELDKVRLIRNGVMHFDPEGIDASELTQLRLFLGLLYKLQAVHPN